MVEEAFASGGSVHTLSGVAPRGELSAPASPLGRVDAVVAAAAAAIGLICAAANAGVSLLQAFNVPLKNSEVVGHPL